MALRGWPLLTPFTGPPPLPATRSYGTAAFWRRPAPPLVCTSRARCHARTARPASTWRFDTGSRGPACDTRAVALQGNSRPRCERVFPGSYDRVRLARRRSDPEDGREPRRLLPVAHQFARFCLRTSAGAEPFVALPRAVRVRRSITRIGAPDVRPIWPGPASSSSVTRPAYWQGSSHLGPSRLRRKKKKNLHDDLV